MYKHYVVYLFHLNSDSVRKNIDNIIDFGNYFTITFLLESKETCILSFFRKKLPTYSFSKNLVDNNYWSSKRGTFTNHTLVTINKCSALSYQNQTRLAVHMENSVCVVNSFPLPSNSLLYGTYLRVVCDIKRYHTPI